MLKVSSVGIQDYLIRQLPVPTVFLDRKLKVVHVSDSWIEAFGFCGRKVTGVSILELFPGASRDWIGILKKCLRGAGPVSGTERHLAGGQEETWFEWTNLPWYDADENIAGVLIQTQDITARIRSELEAEKTRQLLEAKAEIAKIGSWEYNAMKDELYWCPMTRKIHEVGDPYVPTVETAIHFYKEGYSRNTISMAFYRAMETGEPWSEKLQLVTASGREIWVIAAGKALFKEGEYIGLIGTFQDVTESTLSELKTRESEVLLRTVVDNLPLNVYIKDLESRKILVNKAECAYLGAASPSELLGKTDFELYAPEVAQISREEDLHVMNNGASILGKETFSVRKDGGSATFLTSKIPLYDADNRIYGLVGISMDITALKQKEEELRHLIHVSSLQNKKLIHFAHIVSHNLRSHTANFSMLLDFLTQEEDESEKKRILGMLTQASDNLLETLDNLNEVVAINTHVNLAKKRIPLVRAIEAVRQNLAGFLEENRAALACEIPGDATVLAVPAYLESILMNLITNGVKYRHPQRDPVIRVGLEHLRGYAVLVVADNGLGIDLAKYGDKLFGMYKTFHDHPDARGIGLFITKNQVEAMNGKIRASSVVGEGTTFKIYFHEEA